MNTAIQPDREPALFPALRRMLASTVAVAIVLSGMPGQAAAALTDLSQIPIAANATVQGKPNIMLLMDTSGSMAWTHMPDEVEKVGATDYRSALGYRSSQCNQIYYDPLVRYELPKLPDGTFFNQPSFNAAPYAGFASYFVTPDAIDMSIVDLSTSFRAFDGKTTRAGYTSTPYDVGSADPAQPAYYYVYTGPQVLTYASAACRQPDTGASVAATGGGNWIRVLVSATSGPPGRADERGNFAIWYSFYRTRLSLIKTAASLAFAPLTDSFRVGMITVEPKATPTDTTIDQAKYTAIADFTQPQRDAWYQKLFAQPAEGASPAREGLARVGRHYAGQQDGINAGMTGDPVQYSCQQNFTIMTTDGYWNAQTETPGAGPVKIDGVTPVASVANNPDGILTPPSGLSPRPIWEGTATDTVVTTDNRNQFSYSPCGTYFYESTSQTSRSTTQLTYASSQIVTRTRQVTEATRQDSRTTTQVTESTLQHQQSTAQIFQTDTQVRQSTAQITRATSQVTQYSTQLQQRQERIDRSTSQRQRRQTQTTQSTSRTDQNTLQTLIATSRWDRSTSQITQTTAQTTESTSQLNTRTSQTSRSTSQTQQSTVQWTERTSQDRTCDARTEQCSPVPTGSCTPAGFFYCDVAQTGPTLVASCIPETANAGNNYINRTCTSVTTGPTFVASCTPQSANAGNNYTSTLCTPVNTGPTPVATCTAQSPTSGNSYTTTTCGTINGTWTPTGSCTPQLASAANSYVATECTTLTSGPTGVASCTSQAPNSGNAFVQRTCGTNNTGPTGVAACTNTAPSSGNGWTTISCATATTGPSAVGSCTPASAGAGNSWVATTCNNVTTGPTPVASCAPSGATSGNNWTATTCTNVVGTATPVQTCTPAAGNSGNGYTATTCTPVNTGPTGVASCTASGPTSPNWTTTTCGSVDSGWVAVSSCTSGAANSGNAYVTTSCQTVTSGPTAVASCTNSAASSNNAWTATSCVTVVVQPWTNTGTCTPQAANAGNGFVRTLCRTVNGAAVGVASCTPSAPNGSGQGIGCNTATTPPTGVASCTAQSPTAGNGYLTVTCGTNNTGPTLVASCTPSGPNAGNQYTTTSCAPTTVGPYAVASCTNAVAGSANNFTATSCSTTTTGPTGVQACTPVPASASNNYVATTCNDAVTGPTPQASCTAIPASSGNSWIATTCATINTGPTLVANCTEPVPSAGNNWTTTTCSSALTPPTPVSSCTPQTPNAGNSFVEIACATIVSPDVGVASCTAVSASSANNWTATECATIASGGGTDTCTAQVGDANNGYVDISCATVTTGPTLVPPTGCSAALESSLNNWTRTTCSTVTTGPVLVGSCMPVTAGPANNYVETTCTSAAGSKISYATTTTITTQSFNAGNPIGAPIVTSSTGPLTDLDGVCYAPSTEPSLPTPNPQSAGLLAGPYPPSGCTAWPCTVATANANGSINSLADVAQYYYATDLRPTMIDNVPTVGSGPEDDRVSWQHMTTFTVGLGVSGTLNYRPDYKSSGTTVGDFAEIRTGVRNWPVWPDPALNYDPAAGGSFANWENPKSIDDFWHTAVNGRGTYFNAKRPETLVTGLADALADVGVRTGSGSPVTVSSSEPKVGDNFAFTTLYTTQRWTGDVQGFNIDLLTGDLSTTPNWSAQAKLDTMTGGSCDNRNIFLFRAGATDNLVNFTWNSRTCDGSGNPIGAPDTGLNAAEMAFFGASSTSNLGQYLAMTDGTAGTVDQRSAAEGANLVNFIRGQRGLEGFVPNDLTKLYRTRDHVLGDIVNGQAAYVKAPFAAYQDPGYDVFKSAQSGRTPMLYVPANDGMLHAFYAGTSASDTQGGSEAWAFMPTAVLPNVFKLADTFYKNHHEFFVDGTPVVADAYDGGAWKTILVAGLNGGGKSFYALDVTDPASPKALWEFKRSNTCYDGTSATAAADCHIGYSYGKPVVTKLLDGTWVVLVTSGYNNVSSPGIAGDGQGYLYVLNAFTGRIIHKIGTGAGTPTTPSGLAQINAYVDYALYNNTVRQVYGGDLLGNVWRFDVNDTIAPSGLEAALIGTAKDPGGAAQPITTRPELAELNGRAMLFVGTGRLLGASDFADTQVQSVYGIADTLAPGTVYPGSLRTTFRPLGMTASGATRSVACNGTTAECGSTDGWVVDLPASGERVNVEMRLARGTLVFASNLPSSQPCTTGGTSWLNQLSFATGLPVSTSGNVASLSLFDSLATGVTVIGINGGLRGIRQFSDARNDVRNIDFDTPPPTGKRISWREIAR